MSNTISLSFRVSEETADKLEDLASATDRPKSWLMEQALRSYLETEAWQIARIKKGLKELSQGKAMEHEKVQKWLASWGKSSEKTPPK